MTVRVTNSNEGLETCTLTGTSLLLDRHDLHDFILEVREEVIDNLKLLDREREEVNLLQRPDLSIFHKSSELSYGNPIVK